MLVVASNNGVLKVFDQKTSKVSASWGTPDKAREIDELLFANLSQNEVLVAFKNGDIVNYSLNGEIVRQLNKSEERIACMHLHDAVKLITCTQQGTIKIRTYPGDELVKSFSLNRPISAARFANEQLLVAGGQGSLAQLINLETGKEIWKARNVPHDFLDMEVPIWDKDIDWVNANKNVFVAVTAHHEVRLYDARAQRRPVMNVPVGEKPFKCVRTNPLNNNIIITGNASAAMNLLDIRKSCLLLGSFKGIAGSIRSISCHPTQHYIAAVGLDRLLHVFDSRPNSRKPIERAYVKQRLNKVIFSALEVSTNQEPEDENKKNETLVQNEQNKDKITDTGEDEDVFDSLPVIGDQATHNPAPSSVNKLKVTSSEKIQKRSALEKKLKNSPPQKKQKTK